VNARGGERRDTRPSTFGPRPTTPSPPRSGRAAQSFDDDGAQKQLPFMGCDSTPDFSGTWRGANSTYSAVTLTLQQFGDSLSGHGLATFATPADSLVSDTLVGAVAGESLYVHGTLLGSIGLTPRYTIEFGGRADPILGPELLIGCLTVGPNACSTITLRAQ